jgi:hypothetical protein
MLFCISAMTDMIDGVVKKLEITIRFGMLEQRREADDVGPVRDADEHVFGFIQMPCPCQKID